MIGQTLGPYRILAKLGEGGMGEVYRAHDPHLARDVAIKTVSASVAADPERLARFSREARMLAALSHPNIGAIYGFEPGVSSQPPALVLELVEGETLNEILAGGPLSLPRALGVARQVAEAIDFAHERGVIHRDLKPANIKITPDGQVKVLDFGIAKALGENDPARDDASTPTRAAITDAGLVIGTPEYMSPEQARGEVVDRRADIWAFGCLLYEMLTGARAFGGKTGAEAIGAVLHREPDWTALPAGTPPAVRRVLGRCLEKERKARYRDIGDVRADLVETRADESPMVQPARRSRMTPLRALGAAAAAALLGLAAGQWRSIASPSAHVPEPTRIVRLTNGPHREFAPAISPDGKWVAYVSAGAAGQPERTDVWVRFIGGGDPINLTASAELDITTNSGIGGLDISPEGNRIAVMAKPRNSTGPFATWEIPAPLPGQPRKLLDDGMLGARWSPDGKQITFIRAGASAGDALWVADADGANRREIIEADAGIHIHWPAWSRDRRIYFNRTRSTIANLDQSDVYRVSADGGRAEPVVTTSRRAIFPMVSPDNRGLFYASDQESADLAIYWRSLDGGATVPMTRGLGDYSESRLSADGRAIVATFSELRQSIARLSLSGTGAVEQPVTDGFTGDFDPTVSPRGDRLVFSSSRNGSRNLWVSGLDGSRPRPLTSGDVLDQWPSMSPDGREVAFVSDRGGRRGIWLISAEGGSPRHLVDAESIGGLSWTSDGKAVLYSADDGHWPGLFEVFVENGKVQRLATPGVATDPACNPAGDVVAYLSPRTTGASFTELRFVDLEGHPRYEQVAPAPAIPAGFGNGQVAWSPDGHQIAIVSQNSNAPASIWTIEPAAARPEFRKQIELPTGPRIRGISWASDGRSLIIGKHDTTSDIVLIDLRLP